MEEAVEERRSLQIKGVMPLPLPLALVIEEASAGMKGENF